MKKEYTILAPMMAPIHFRLIINVLRNCGYKFELLENDGPNVVQEGLKYVHNDTCYPALLVIGQFIDALHSGKYDVNKTALVITQTGGGCRASNYIHLLRKALKKAGLEQVPVISMNLSFLESNPGFHITLPMIRKFVAAMVYGDALMLLRNQTEAYEVHKGESNAKGGKMERIPDRPVQPRQRAFAQTAERNSVPDRTRISPRLKLKRFQRSKSALSVKST